MKDLKTQLTGALMSLEQPETTSGLSISDFSDQEKDSTAYFFLRMQNLYGGKYQQQFPEEDDIKMAKREWAKRIGQLTREQIDNAFESIKTILASGDSEAREPYIWPDIGAIIAAHTHGWEHRVHERQAAETDRMLGERRLRLEDQGAKARSKAARDKAMAEIGEFRGTAAGMVSEESE